MEFTNLFTLVVAFIFGCHLISGYQTLDMAMGFAQLEVQASDHLIGIKQQHRLKLLANGGQ